MTKRYKYPRTSHLPWSPGATRDDIHLYSYDRLEDQEVIVTEKLDGENTTLYRDALHARSIDSRSHISRDWVKAFHGRIKYILPSELRICGENMYAMHSIKYTELESYFYLFSVWRDALCLSWEETVEWANQIGAPTPPILYQGVWDEERLRSLHHELDLERQEGYVVRPLAAFTKEEFTQVVGKWVRKNHVQTNDHWMHSAVVPNQLKRST